MKKMIWLLMLLGLLMACGPSTTELVPPETNVNVNVYVDTAASTDTNTETSQTVEQPGAIPPAANLDDFVPASTAEEAAVTRTQDWRKGATDPLVVIIEYGDFQ